MTYSQLSAHDPTDDAEGNEVDSRTPLDKTIDQIGMGTYFLPPLHSVYVPSTSPIPL
jgi:hypothetical protein